MSEENMTQAPGLTLPDDAAPASSVSADDRLLAFSEAGEPVTATAGQVSDYVQEQIPYVGENLCAIHDFTLATNAGNNQLPPEGFAKQSPLLKSGQTYIISGKRDGERGGQCMVSDGGVFKVVNFYTPFTLENDVEVVYFRSTQPSSTVVYSDVKIEVGSRATPFIPGIIASVLPMSLSEQLVPGEFWLCADGITRQVYIRTFKGTTPNADFVVLDGVSSSQFVTGGISSSDATVVLTPPGFLVPEHPNIFLVYWTYYTGNGGLNISRIGDGLKNKAYSLTFKYTKA